MLKNNGLTRGGEEWPLHELRELLAHFGRCKPNRIKASTRLREDLGIDSFTAVEVLVLIEQRFNCRLSETEAEKVIAFRDLVDLVRRKGTKNL